MMICVLLEGGGVSKGGREESIFENGEKNKKTEPKPLAFFPIALSVI